MKTYTVRQKSTGLYIPILERGAKRGGSRVEPTNERSPRMFPSHRSAQSFLGNWLQGIHQNEFTIDSYGNEDWGIKVTPQLHRNKADMEIVEFELVECIHEKK